MEGTPPGFSHVAFILQKVLTCGLNQEPEQRSSCSGQGLAGRRESDLVLETRSVTQAAWDSSDHDDQMNVCVLTRTLP